MTLTRIFPSTACHIRPGASAADVAARSTLHGLPLRLTNLTLTENERCTLGPNKHETVGRGEWLRILGRARRKVNAVVFRFVRSLSYSVQRQSHKLLANGESNE